MPLIARRHAPDRQGSWRHTPVAAPSAYRASRLRCRSRYRGNRPRRCRRRRIRRESAAGNKRVRCRPARVRRPGRRPGLRRPAGRLSCAGLLSQWQPSEPDRAHIRCSAATPSSPQGCHSLARSASPPHPAAPHDAARRLSAAPRYRDAPRITAARSSMPSCSSGLTRTATTAPAARHDAIEIRSERPRGGTQCRRRKILQLLDQDIGAACRRADAAHLRWRLRGKARTCRVARAGLRRISEPPVSCSSIGTSCPGISKCRSRGPN